MSRPEIDLAFARQLTETHRRTFGRSLGWRAIHAVEQLSKGQPGELAMLECCAEMDDLSADYFGYRGKDSSLIGPDPYPARAAKLYERAAKESSDPALGRFYNLKVKEMRLREQLPADLAAFRSHRKTVVEAESVLKLRDRGEPLSHLLPVMAVIADYTMGEADDSIHVLARTGKLDKLSALLELPGTNVHAVSSDGLTPLMAAAMAGQRRVVDLLLDHGSARELQNPGNVRGGWENIVLLAAENGHRDIADMLIEKGGIIGEHQATRLLHTALSGPRSDPGLAKWALAKGANPFAGKPGERTALHATAELGDASVVAAMLPAGRDFTREVRTLAGRESPMMLAVRGGHLDAMRLLQSAGADLDETMVREIPGGQAGAAAEPTGEQVSLLRLAAESRRFDVAQWLLQQSPDDVRRVRVNERVPPDGRTLLMLAAEQRDASALVEWFQAAGGDANQRDDGGKTALWYAMNPRSPSPN